MDLLILQCTTCNNETPRFGNVGGTSGGTKLEPNLLDHTCSFLLLVFVEIEGLDKIVVDLRGQKFGLVDFPSYQEKR